MAENRQSPRPVDTQAVTAGLTSVQATSETAATWTLLLKDRYRIERELGRGGIGAVYLAHDQQLHDKPVVIKVMHSAVEASQYLDYFQQKFQQEVKALVRLDHPGIVGVSDAGETPEGKPFFVMQYVEGQTLRHAIGPKGMELSRVANIVRQIGHALSAAHDKGIYHRDLKPENVMLQDLGRGEELVKLIDFGMATVKDSQSAVHAEVTKVAGTLPYMAPEQLRGRPVAASDIYACGVIAYEMVTGYLPFKSDSPVQQYELQRAGVDYLPCELRPRLPIEAQTVLLKALSFHADERFESARAFGDALAQALAGAQENADKATLRLGTGETRPAPVAGGDLVSAERQAHVHTFDTPAQAARATQVIDEKRLTRFTNPARFFPVSFISVGLTLLLLVAVAWWMKQQTARFAADPLAGTPTTSTSPISPGAPVPLAVQYSLVVQRYRSGKPYKEPYQLAGVEAFNLEEGDHLRFQVKSAQPGYLYLLNVGPQLVNGQPDYNLLFPATPVNGGQARVEAETVLQVPGPDVPGGFLLDGQNGTERVWLIWSAEPVAVLEGVRPRLQRDVALVEAADIRAVQDFLAQLNPTQPEVNLNATTKQAWLHGAGPLLATLLSFEHH